MVRMRCSAAILVTCASSASSSARRRVREAGERRSARCASRVRPGRSPRDDAATRRVRSCILRSTGPHRGPGALGAIRLRSSADGRRSMLRPRARADRVQRQRPGSASQLRSAPTAAIGPAPPARRVQTEARPHERRLLQPPAQAAPRPPVPGRDGRPRQRPRVEHARLRLRPVQGAARWCGTARSSSTCCAPRDTAPYNQRCARPPRSARASSRSSSRRAICGSRRRR